MLYRNDVNGEVDEVGAANGRAANPNECGDDQRGALAEPGSEWTHDSHISVKKD